jgi:hypothetical protein
VNYKTPSGRSLLPSTQPQAQSKKTSRRQSAAPRGQQQRIDQQIWLLHQAMAEKLIKQPALAVPIRHKLDAWQQQGQIRHGAFLFWNCLLDLLPEPALFRAELLSMDAQPCKYRRRTPFIGILTEEERWAALSADAISDPSAVVKNQVEADTTADD